jgi:hypothetical protein
MRGRLGAVGAWLQRQRLPHWRLPPWRLARWSGPNWRLPGGLRLWITCGSLGFLFAALLSHGRQLRQYHLDVQGWLWLTLGLGCCLLSLVVSGLAWVVILRWLGWRPRPIPVVSLYILTNLRKFLPGGIWHLASRVQALRQPNTALGGAMEMPTALLVVLIEPLLAATAALTLVSLGGWQSGLGAIALVPLALLAPRWLNPLLRRLERGKASRLGLVEAGSPQASPSEPGPTVAEQAWPEPGPSQQAPPAEVLSEQVPSEEASPEQALSEGVPWRTGFTFPADATPLAAGRAGQVASYPLAPLLAQLVFVLLRFAGFACCVWAFDLQHTVAWTIWLSGFALAWTVGLVVPGAPGGLGVFESTLLLRLSLALPEPAVLAVALSYRLVVTLADLLAAGLAGLDEKIAGSSAGWLLHPGALETPPSPSLQGPPP